MHKSNIRHIPGHLSHTPRTFPAKFAQMPLNTFLASLFPRFLHPPTLRLLLWCSCWLENCWMRLNCLQKPVLVGSTRLATHYVLAEMAETWVHFHQWGCCPPPLSCAGHNWVEVGVAGWRLVSGQWPAVIFWRVSRGWAF